MLFSWLSKKQSITYSVIFDIGTDQVSGSLVAHHVGLAPQIMMTRTVRLSVYDNPRIDQLLISVGNALREVITMIAPSCSSAPTDIVVHVGSPWYHAQIRHIQYHRRTPFIVSRKLLRDLMHKEYHKFTTVQHKEWKKMHHGFVPLEHHITDVRLQGYHYHDPVGKKTEQLDISLFVSMIMDDMRQLCEQSIYATWPNNTIQFHTALYQQYFALSSHHDTPADYVIADIRGEITDIALIRDHVIQDIFSLPVGDHTIVRLLAQYMQVPASRVGDMIELYTTDMLHDQDKKLFEFHQPKIYEQITMSLVHAIESVSRHGFLPSVWYGMGQYPYREWFIDMYGDHRVAHFTTMHKGISLQDTKYCTIGKVLDEELLRNERMLLYTLALVHQTKKYD